MHALFSDLFFVGLTSYGSEYAWLFSSSARYAADMHAARWFQEHMDACMHVYGSDKQQVAMHRPAWNTPQAPATWYCTDSTASYDYVAPSFSFYLLSRLDQGVIVSREWRFFILGQNREWHLCHILLIIYPRMGWSMPMIDVPYQYQAVY